MIELDSKIQEVTVYPDRARVSRQGRAEVKPGPEQVTFANLPMTLDPASVRARARGTARTKILGVDLKKSFFEDAPPGRAGEIEVQIQALEDEDRAFSDRQETLGKQIEHLDGISEASGTFASSMTWGKTSQEEHSGLLDYFAEKRSSKQQNNREITIQRREIAKKIAALKKELDRIQNASPRERYSATIELEVLEAGHLDVELVVLQSGARWEPLYDIRFQDGQLQISYLGQVTQSSGEDWENISLNLSTATPALAAVLPELNPWYVYPYKPPAARRKASRGVAVSATAAGQPTPQGAPAPASDQEKNIQADFAQAEVREEAASVSYHIGSGIDIPGDKSPHKTMIAEFGLPPVFDYAVTPGIAQAAYRRIKAENTSPFTLLPGKAQLFEGQNYIGATRLKRLVSGQELELYLGVDDRIHVERELVRREMDKKFMADRRRIRFGYEIKLENHTGESQEISLYDQIPVPRNEAIKVRLESSTPKVHAQDELNRLEWLLALEAGEKQTVRFDFSVEYPREMAVRGLP